MLFGVPAVTPAANGNAPFGGQAFQFVPAVQSNEGSAQVSNAGVGLGGSHQAQASRLCQPQALQPSPALVQLLPPCSSE
ncbi:hypothetical protein HaLaN_06492 [Haematococcus lacustris]|uniref:Uncharacterized protein n=1 Tax=Haematococcus lacustris TaxID=44745 RepID=A0A699YX12_HAELA|nr:hypothetical protein HaLaN_06492 [Haematococcus lacustris]